ncbi:MAG: hypothetical protein ABI690_15270 [Chloroflexota bacterium]
MPVTVEWDDEQKNAVVITYLSPWTWKEFDPAVNRMLELFDSVQHKVDVIFDIRKGGFPPPEAMKRFKGVAEISHPNGGQLVFVAPGMLAQFVKGLVQILDRAFWGFGTFENPKFVFTKSLEEARAFLDDFHKRHAKAG